MQPRVITGVSALLASLVLACGSSPTAVLHGARGTVSVRLEVADTDAARTKGLMFRAALAEGDGMLFVFDDSREHGFWMKNTFIPLDMIFIGEDRRVVGVHAEAVPQSTDTISVGVPSRYVLEVPGGWAARHGIAAGARVDLQGVPAS
jgi:uncharacterized membrane protein (UPF0127 family)